MNSTFTKVLPGAFSNHGRGKGNPNGAMVSFGEDTDIRDKR